MFKLHFTFSHCTMSIIGTGTCISPLPTNDDDTNKVKRNQTGFLIVPLRVALRISDYFQLMMKRRRLQMVTNDFLHKMPHNLSVKNLPFFPFSRFFFAHGMSYACGNLVALYYILMLS